MSAESCPSLVVISESPVERIKGIYEPILPVVDEFPVYRLSSCHEILLRFHFDRSQWLCCASSFDIMEELNPSVVYAILPITTAARGLPVSSTENPWQVYDIETETWVNSPSIVSVTHDHNELSRRSPYSILVEGTTGGNAATINGLYLPTEEQTVTGFQIYQKSSDPDVWLLYRAVKTDWRICSTAHKSEDDILCFGYLDSNTPLLPNVVSLLPTSQPWKVFDNSLKLFTPQSTIQTSLLLPEQAEVIVTYERSITEKKQAEIECNQLFRANGTVEIRNKRGYGKIHSDYLLEFNEFNTFIGEVFLDKGKVYYEVEVIESGPAVAQIGWVTRGFPAAEKADGKGVGNDDYSWGFDGIRNKLWGNNSLLPNQTSFGSPWANGTILGLAADIDGKSLSLSVNGSYLPPDGVGFVGIKASYLSPAFSAASGGRYRVNFGDRPFRHSPPVEGSYLSVHDTYKQTLFDPEEAKDANILVKITGLSGYNSATINGTYLPTAEVQHGCTVFQKLENRDIWLLYDPVNVPSNRSWRIQETSDKGVNAICYGYLTCTRSPPVLPHKCHGSLMKIYDGSKFIEREECLVQALSLEEAAAAGIQVPYLLERKTKTLQRRWIAAERVVLRNHRGLGRLEEDYTVSFADFNTVVADVPLTEGRYYYEVEVIRPVRVPQIGWMTYGALPPPNGATAGTGEVSPQGMGVGDDDYSWGFDGIRRKCWGNPSRESFGSEWQSGDVLGLYAVITDGRADLWLSVNGDFLSPNGLGFESIPLGHRALFPAASSSTDGCYRFNFGERPLRYPPSVPYQSIHDCNLLRLADFKEIHRSQAMVITGMTGTVSEVCTGVFRLSERDLLHLPVFRHSQWAHIELSYHPSHHLWQIVNRQQPAGEDIYALLRCQRSEPVLPHRCYGSLWHSFSNGRWSPQSAVKVWAFDTMSQAEEFSESHRQQERAQAAEVTRQAQEQFRSLGLVFIKDYRGTGVIQGDYTLHFRGFNTFLGEARVSQGRVYWEVEIIRLAAAVQFGWVTEKFLPTATEAATELLLGVGDDNYSWAVDGVRQERWGRPIDGNKFFGSPWKEGDVIGLAVDCDTKSLFVSVNGCFAHPNGTAFRGLDFAWVSPALSATTGGVVKVNFGERPLRYSPPDPSYVTVYEYRRQMERLRTEYCRSVGLPVHLAAAVCHLRIEFAGRGIDTARKDRSLQLLRLFSELKRSLTESYSNYSFCDLLPSSYEALVDHPMNRRVEWVRQAIQERIEVEWNRSDPEPDTLQQLESLLVTVQREASGE